MVSCTIHVVVATAVTVLLKVYLQYSIHNEEFFHLLPT